MSTTIQSIIIETLLEHTVVEYNNQKMKVGHSYDEVLEIVKSKVKQHPMLDDNCDTSKNCITWYASKMRNQDTKFYNKLMLEIERPRKSNQKSKSKEVVVKK